MKLTTYLWLIALSSRVLAADSLEDSIGSHGFYMNWNYLGVSGGLGQTQGIGTQAGYYLSNEDLRRFGSQHGMNLSEKWLSNFGIETEMFSFEWLQKGGKEYYSANFIPWSFLFIWEYDPAILLLPVMLTNWSVDYQPFSLPVGFDFGPRTEVYFSEKSPVQLDLKGGIYWRLSKCRIDAYWRKEVFAKATNMAGVSVNLITQ